MRRPSSLGEGGDPGPGGATGPLRLGALGCGGGHLVWKERQRCGGVQLGPPACGWSTIKSDSRTVLKIGIIAVWGYFWHGSRTPADARKPHPRRRKVRYAPKTCDKSGVIAVWAYFWRGSRTRTAPKVCASEPHGNFTQSTYSSCEGAPANPGLAGRAAGAPPAVGGGFASVRCRRT